MIEYINNNTPLYISTDGAREEINRCDGWIIATYKDHRIIHGFNPDYRQPEDVYSYRFYASLVLLIFINIYIEYFDITIKNRTHGLCDNEA